MHFFVSAAKCLSSLNTSKESFNTAVARYNLWDLYMGTKVCTSWLKMREKSLSVLKDGLNVNLPMEKGKDLTKYVISTPIIRKSLVCSGDCSITQIFTHSPDINSCFCC